MSDLKIFAKTIEEKAKAQIDLLLEQEAFSNCKVRIMPDVHAGAGCVIGFTANLGDKIIPNIVGVDIGCGMQAYKLKNKDIDFEQLDNVIRQYVPSGVNTHEKEADYDIKEKIQSLHCYNQLKNKSHIYKSIGTLGGGNHFIEVDKDENGHNYLIIHSGSRNLGKQVADIYQKLAIKECHSMKTERAAIIQKMKEEGREQEIFSILKNFPTKNSIPNSLCYLDGENAQKYLHDMRICQEYASLNRKIIASIIFRNTYLGAFSSFETIHNYIDNNGMVRKGAICANDGIPVLIPLNMRDGCIYGFGKGNEDWNCSAPHGAGRLMSRKEAKGKVSIEDYKNAMQSVYTTSVNEDTLDEAPQAYKPMQDIIDMIQDTVQVRAILKPVYNFKASE